MEPWLGRMFHGSVTGWHRGSNLPVSLAPCQVLVLVRDIWEMLGTKMLHEAGRPLWTVPNRRIRTTGARLRQPLVPILLGRGVRLWEGLEGIEERYDVESLSSPSSVTHIKFTRR